MDTTSVDIPSPPRLISADVHDIVEFHVEEMHSSIEWKRYGDRIIVRVVFHFPNPGCCNNFVAQDITSTESDE